MLIGCLLMRRFYMLPRLSFFGLQPHRRSLPRYACLLLRCIRPQTGHPLFSILAGMPLLLHAVALEHMYKGFLCWPFAYSILVFWRVCLCYGFYFHSVLSVFDHRKEPLHSWGFPDALPRLRWCFFFLTAMISWLVYCFLLPAFSGCCNCFFSF